MYTVYIETSIVSYLRQRQSAHVVIAAHQLLTRKWWDTERTRYELVVSQYVLDEAAAGVRVLLWNVCKCCREFHCYLTRLRLLISLKKLCRGQFYRRKLRLMRCISLQLPITAYNIY